jgi:hypothetical protein
VNTALVKSGTWMQIYYDKSNSLLVAGTIISGPAKDIKLMDFNFHMKEEHSYDMLP